MTIGDVFSVVAAIFGIFVTEWATVVAMALLFPGAVERAREEVRTPRKAIVRGLFILVVAGAFGVGMAANPFPLVKLAGWAVVLMALAIAAVGTAGVAKEAGSRIRQMDPEMAAYPAYVRGSAYVVGATILPILGWFAFGPLLLIAALGAGWKAVASAPDRARAFEA